MVATCTTDLDHQLVKLKVPGLAAGIIKNGKLVCTAVAGMANVEQDRPVTPDTLFMLASTSKTVTATALMTLFDDGKVGLEDDVNAHLPFHVEIPSCPTGTITVRQLLTHTSSIKDNLKIINCPLTCAYGDPLSSFVTKGADSPIPLRDFTEEYLTRAGAYYYANANFEAGCPGTIDDYSNMGLTLAGYLTEALSGTSLEQLSKDRIFTPLGMHETAWKLASIDPSHLAVPYDYATSTGFTPYGQYGEPDFPDGDLRSSVTELSRFLIMFIQSGQLEGTRILAESTALEMRRPQIPHLDPDQGLIWFYTTFGSSPRVLGHDGSDNGVSTNMFFDPSTGAGVILLSNGMWNDANGNSAGADLLMERLFQEAASY